MDGVISLFGFAPTASSLPGRFHWIDGVAHCIPDVVGERLIRLAERFELVWATGWEEKANEYLPFILGLPDDELPCLMFQGRAVFGSAHWKLDAIDEYAGGRPAAWIDDNLDDACRYWAAERDAAHQADRDARGHRHDRRARGGAAGLGRRGGRCAGGRSGLGAFTKAASPGVPILWPCAPSASATGVLRAEWYHDTGLQHLARVDGDNKIDFDWDDGQPAGMNNTFSVRWSGQISPRYSEQYRFVITRDDVARLWVGGQLLFNDDWNDEHSGAATSDPIVLQADHKYDLKLEFADGDGDPEIHLAWKSSSQAKQIVPASRLFAPAPSPAPGVGPDGSGSPAASTPSLSPPRTACLSAP